MKPDRFQLVRAVYHEICELPERERQLALQQRDLDPEIRTEVEELLSYSDESNEAEEQDVGAIGRRLVEDASTSDLAQRILQADTSDGDHPRDIGGYRILRRVGAGGMGIIYEARQESPERRVALKVMRPGLLDEPMAKRFAREAHVLGQLHHPGIAQIYEAGVSGDADAQPFLAMELVEGESLARHADEYGLDTLQRLELVARVCDAVHHAHQRGFIHRDLKPTNVLVVPGEDSPSTSATGASETANTDSIGQPKVLDFGIARVTDTEATPLTMQTEPGQVVGTLAYMSPEQVEGRNDQLDTRTDVYSLGVMLYEVLGRALPIDVRDVHLSEAARMICEDEPARLGTIDRRLRGDVETMVAVAMDKDRERRYGSAAEFAADLRRYRNHEPIEARPASFRYRAIKFARRYRLQVASIAIAFLALLGGVIGTVAGLIDARTSLAKFDLLALGDRVEAASLRVEGLGISHGENTSRFRAWLAEAEELLATRPVIERTLASLRADAEVRELSSSSEARASIAAELEVLTASRDARARANAVRRGELRPEPFALADDELPETAPKLDALAQSLVGPKRETVGRAAEGVALARRAVELEKSWPSPPLHTLAWGLFRLGLDDEARATCREALDKAPLDLRRDFKLKQMQLEAAIATAKSGASATRLARDGVRIAELEVQLGRWQLARDRDQYLHDALHQLIAKLHHFETEHVDVIRARLAWTSAVESLAKSRDAERWSRARAAIRAADGRAASKSYAAHPVDLQPQPGLVPMGANPVTGLWEFYHLASAHDPASGAEPADLPIPEHRSDGSIDVGDDTGIVFVLIPGGTFWMGAQDRDASARNYDPQGASGLSQEPVHEVELRPFFLARHETTQGQWQRLSRGERPSRYEIGFGYTGIRRPIGYDHPVETVAWEDANALLIAHGLALPTEAQWEYACRARTELSTTAKASDRLAGIANVLDRTALRHYPSWGSATADFEDGFAGPAPVASFKPNAWGMYDMQGNVIEWCMDRYGPYSLPAREGDGLRKVPVRERSRVARGGYFAGPVLHAMPTYRTRMGGKLGGPTTGVRAARRLSQ